MIKNSYHDETNGLLLIFQLQFVAMIFETNQKLKNKELQIMTKIKMTDFSHQIKMCWSNHIISCFEIYSMDIIEFQVPQTHIEKQ